MRLVNYLQQLAITAPAESEGSSLEASEGGDDLAEVINLFYKEKTVNGSNVGHPHIDYEELFNYLVDMPESHGITKHRKAIDALYTFSGSENYVLSFIEHKNLLHILMAHAGVYISCFHRKYTHANYGSVLDIFWKENLPSVQARVLLCENFYGHVGGNKDNCCPLCECGNEDFDFLVNHCGNFNDSWSKMEEKQENGTKKVFIMIATIIKNLTSRSIKDAQMIACDNTCLRFVVLLLYCSIVELKEAGLEILINISRWMVLQHPLWKMYINVVHVWNSDIDVSLKHLKIIQKWCETSLNGKDRRRAKENYEQIKSCLKFEEISQLLFSCAVKNRVGICTSILEAVWNISRLGKSACNDICSEKSLISQLFALITCQVGKKNDESMSTAIVPATVSNDKNKEDINTQTPLPDPCATYLNSVNTNKISDEIELPYNYCSFLRPSTAASSIMDPKILDKARILVTVAQAIIRNLVASADEGHRIALRYKEELTLQMKYVGVDNFLQWILSEIELHAIFTN